jgi:hypothetical protein
MATDQVLLLWAPADHFRSDLLTRKFDAQEIVSSASTSMALKRLLDQRNRSRRPSNVFSPVVGALRVRWAVYRTE